MTRVVIPQNYFNKKFGIAKSRTLKKIKSNEKSFGNLLRREIIKNNILKGVSPVDGKGDFPDYSESYKKQIKRSLGAFGKKVKPVNLKLSGQMLSTFFVNVAIVANKISAEIGFTDELFEIHNNKGAGKSKVKRRMLPTGTNERFNNNIRKSIERFLDRIFR